MGAQAALTHPSLIQLCCDYTSGCLEVGPSLATQVFLAPNIRQDFLC